MLSLEEFKLYLGISGDDDDDFLNCLIIAADEDLRSKVGNYKADSTKAKLYMMYWAGAVYADRFGTMTLKENSALRDAMQNIIATLRVEVMADATSSDE